MTNPSTAAKTLTMRSTALMLLTTPAPAMNTRAPIVIHWIQNAPIPTRAMNAPMASMRTNIPLKCVDVIVTQKSTVYGLPSDC